MATMVACSHIVSAAAIRATFSLRSAPELAATSNRRDQYLRRVTVRKADPAVERVRKIESAGRIWRASLDPGGTLAEKYLNGRGIDLADDLRGRVLRFHSACPWGIDAVPALIAAFHPITEPDDHAPPTAILRIGLNADGSKIAKKMLGPVARCAIKLDPAENVSHGLGTAEGLETALAVRATGWRPVWALGSAGAIENFPPLAGVEALTIFADNDESGRGTEAAQACAARWSDAGSEVFIRTPNRTGADWADII